MMREVLEIDEILNQVLQKKSQDIVNVIQLVSSTKLLLQKMKENGCEKFRRQGG
jgi:hypothetical protein